MAIEVDIDGAETPDWLAAFAARVQAHPEFTPNLRTSLQVVVNALGGYPCSLAGAVPKAVHMLRIVAPELRSVTIEERLHYQNTTCRRLAFSLIVPAMPDAKGTPFRLEVSTSITPA